MKTDPKYELNPFVDPLIKAAKCLQAIYESTRSIRIVVDPDHTVLFFNKKAREQFFSVFGIEIKMGASISNKVRNDNCTENLKIHFQKSLEGDYVSTEDLIGLGNKKVWYKIDFHPLIIDNKTSAVSISIRNINDNKKKEIRIQEQNSLLKDIAFSQSHNVRGPVATILGLVSILNKSELSKENKEIVEFLEITTKKLDKIISEVIIEISKNPKEYKFRNNED